VFDKQKRFAEAESAFRQVLSRDPDNAIALNYLGYMLAERGERLDESVTYLKKALQVEPENPSYLDSLGWAYFKADKLDLAKATCARRRPAQDELRDSGALRPGAVQARDATTKRSRPWTRALGRRRRFDRQGGRRQEDQGREAEASQEVNASRPGFPCVSRRPWCPAASCGAPLMKLPPGPARPRPTPRALKQATAAARASAR
jgi:tetratricopeptide (TPR) repeat protein